MSRTVMTDQISYPYIVVVPVTLNHIVIAISWLRDCKSGSRFGISNPVVYWCLVLSNLGASGNVCAICPFLATRRTPHGASRSVRT